MAMVKKRCVAKEWAFYAVSSNCFDFFLTESWTDYFETPVDGIYAWNYLWHQKQQKKVQRGSCSSHSDKEVVTEGAIL